MALSPVPRNYAAAIGPERTPVGWSNLAKHGEPASGL